MTIRTNAMQGAGIASACLAGAFVALLCLGAAAPALASSGAEAEPDVSFWEELAGFFKDMLPGKAAKVKGAHTRGDGEVVILADPYREEEGGAGRCKLVAGNRTLHLRWRGGEAPFRLYLFRQNGGGTRLLAETTAAARAADLPALEWTPGDYLLVIKDGRDYAKNAEPLAGPATTMDVTALPTGERPSMPTDLAETPAADALKPLLYPTWLANQGDGEWTLEAMQHVAPLAADSGHAAAWLRQWGGD